MKILIVGNREGTNVGGALERAAVRMSLETRVVESHAAMRAPLWIRRANWWLRGRRPTRLVEFSRLVVDECREWRPDCLLAVGIAPLTACALAEIGKLGIRRLDYLTDDPWNPAHRAGWFLQALGQYDVVFSPRRANLGDLRRAGVPCASYLPFAYCPELHFRETTPAEARPTDDLIFAGGGDADRVPVIASILNAGYGVALYGIRWERFKATRECSRGQADACTLRIAHSRAKVALCLPRRANRDGHTMRTFELAAMGACVLAEYTQEHREILGEDGEAAVYFRTAAEMLDRLRWLVDHEDERRRLSAAVRSRITGGPNAYQDRLESMIGLSVAV